MTGRLRGIRSRSLGTLQPTPVSSVVDSGAINSIAPPDVPSVPMTESQGSVNGMQYDTADGTRIPNFGQKTFEAVSEQESALSQIFHSDRRYI